MCKDLFKKWSNLEDSRFSVETVSGGITNLCKFLFYFLILFNFTKYYYWFQLLDLSPCELMRRGIWFTKVVVDFAAVLKVSVKEENGDNVSVTVRLYGPNTDYVINRERELQVIVPSFLILIFDSCALWLLSVECLVLS